MDVTEEEPEQPAIDETTQQSLDSSDEEKSEVEQKTEGVSKIELHELCTIEQLKRLKVKFDEAVDNVMDRMLLHAALKEVLEVDLEFQELNLLFLKINANRNGIINWDEFVSYLLLCFAAKESLEFKYEAGGLVAPINKRPNVFKSQHPHAINCICFSPNVDKDSFDNPIQGSYITTSPEGMVNRWSLDFELIRSTMADCTLRKNYNERTQILTAACMPDVNILAISTTKRELYFYDTTAGGLTARIKLTVWENNILAMFFHSDNIQELYRSFRINTKPKPYVAESICTFVIGDEGGNIYVMTFDTRNLGPFQKRTGKALIKMTIGNAIKGKVPGLNIKEIRNAHNAPIQQVAYYASLNSIVSCSDSITIPLILYSLAGSKTVSMFSQRKDVLCFVYDEEKHSLATGSRDGTVLMWNIFVPVRPNAIFKGHHAAIVIVILQSKSTRLYSLDTNRIIKVWSVRTQNCIQTFSDIPSSLGEHTTISAIYNSGTRDLVLASLQIITMQCDPKFNQLHSDGFTHSQALSMVLYNALFKTVVTCGSDSIIICWDILTGVRQTTIYKAHTRVFNGEVLEVEITAATFDPGYQLLLTGARDGSLKTWNFNTGSCLKNMSIEYMCEVTYVLWVSNRILAVGWNRHITEFDDSSIKAGAMGKVWETRHTEDVSAGALRSGEVLATISYGGELVLWKLDTGRPIRQYLCQNPTERIKIQYSKKSHSKKKGLTSSPSQSSLRRKKSNDMPVDMPQMIQHLAAQAIVFLETRPINAVTANFFIALGDGMVQVWSEHVAGGYLCSFNAVHIMGDYVNCFTTDKENMFLFTGTSVGYIKIWLMTNYCTSEQVHVSMPRLRLQFPFLWRDRVEGRAKRWCRKQPLPLLLSSYRGHLRSISTIVYIPEHNYVLSGSADNSVRIWGLNGQYLGTLGTFLPWTLLPSKPPDVRKVASSTTLKVWNGGEVSRFVPIRGRSKMEITLSDFKLLATLDDKLPSEHLLSRICRLPKHPPAMPNIVLDDSMHHIPIYNHLETPVAKRLPARPRTPPNIRTIRERREAQGPVKKVLQFKEKTVNRDRSGFSFYKND